MIFSELFVSNQSFGGTGDGLGAGFGFFAGLEMPILIRTKPSPLRSESRTLIC